MEHFYLFLCFVPLLIIWWLLRSFWTDRLFDLKVEEKDVLLEELQKPWQVQEKTMETDISVLKWVEDLEQRVVSADLHLKVREISGCLKPQMLLPLLLFPLEQRLDHKTCLFL